MIPAVKELLKRSLEQYDNAEIEHRYSMRKSLEMSLANHKRVQEQNMGHKPTPERLVFVEAANIFFRIRKNL